MSYVILYQIKREAWLYVLLSHDDFVRDSYYSSELQDQCSKLCLPIFNIVALDMETLHQNKLIFLSS